MKVSIGVKALNEEQHIDACLASALEAVRPYGGEVILADSGSTDRTVEIARRRPVRIVTFRNVAERCCGAGAQLAFQHARGEFFCLLDGDMVLDRDFIPAALALLESDPQLAGVGGMVKEVNVEAPEFQITAQSKQKWRAGEVDRLDGGGLYRTAAIRDVGYFADRNLHAFEELDLGVRLRSRGWKLMRLAITAVDHYGYCDQGYRLLWRRVKAGYSGGTGEVLRAALGQRHLKMMLTRFSYLRNAFMVMIWWIVLAGLLVAFTVRPAIALPIAAALVLGPLLLLIVRRRSVQLGLYSLVAWNVSAWGLIEGFFRSRVSPRAPIDSTVLAGDQRCNRFPGQEPKNVA